jgi:adenylosuccinate lyase
MELRLDPRQTRTHHRHVIPNVLAQRYASPAMCAIWSAEGRILIERELWIAVMKAQRDLGLDIPAEAISAYEAVKNQIDLTSIMERERITRHDVKARIEEFNALAGHEHIHKGMTSRDLTENVEQMQAHRSLRLLRDKSVAALARLRMAAIQWRDLVLTARTHNVAAQPTTLGRRIAMHGEELLSSFESLETLIASYPVRGLKGAVGTQMDLLSLFDGDAEKVIVLERRLIEHLGIAALWTNPGQVYPRSLDLRTIAALNDLCSGPASFCKTLRLMAGHGTAGEGFAPGQTGSSAMPHKMNSRSCERVNGLQVILNGHLSMAAGLAGDQWNEGDVSCSVVRRVMLPDACFAADGLFETFLTILDQMEVHEAAIEAETSHHLPFLMTTTVMMAAVRAGVGREAAHAAIKEHALATVRGLQDGSVRENDLAARLANDLRIGLTRDIIDRLIADGRNQVGLAQRQTDAFVAAATAIEAAHPDAARYVPGSIL